MPTIKINKDIHKSIKQYCVFNEVRIERFINEELKNNKKLISFHKRLKIIKV